MPYCAEWTAVKRCDQYHKAIPLYCRRWQCPECAPRRAKKLRAIARDGKPNTFLTLTANPTWGTSKAMRAQKLVRAWKEIRRRALIEAKRDPRKKPLPNGPDLDPSRVQWTGKAMKRCVRLDEGTLPFIAVFEETADGEPHLHILCRSAWINQEWLSKQMAQQMRSPIVDIRRVHTMRQVVSYVAKYVGKNPRHYGGCKRYWWSKEYIIEPWEPDDDEEGNAGWELYGKPIDVVIGYFEQWGCERIMNEGSAYYILDPP